MVSFAKKPSGNGHSDDEEISLLCSSCFKLCTGDNAHVIPWWNDILENFVTTYRCGNCWLTSLDETKVRINVLDEDSRDKFCAFMERHKHAGRAKSIRLASLAEASRMINEFLKDLKSKRVVLHY